MCFSPKSNIAGVPFICDGQFTHSVLPHPRFPSIWDNEFQWTFPNCFDRPDEDMDWDAANAVELINAGKDVDAPTVVFDGCISSTRIEWKDASVFFSALHPVSEVQHAVEAFLSSFAQDEKWIGLHVRHGNGGDIMGHAPYWDFFENAIERCKKAVDAARRQIGNDAKVFLSTDSVEVLDALKRSIDGVFVRQKEFREPGTGELHLGNHAWTGRDDALVEMLLLARSSVLIRYPPGSFFSFYAAVMKPTVLPRPETVSELWSPYDPTDPLSPALLL